jgi:tRNA(Ile)-lysidine synthetase-like protein
VNLNFIDFFSSLETKLFLNYIVSNSFDDEALKITDSHWHNIYEIIKNGKNGLSVNLSNRILLQKERSSIIISIPRTLQNNLLINDESESYNWYDTHISFKSSENYDMNIVPMNLLNNGSYISHWKKGDKIHLKNSTKKISDIFIDNKISNYDKLYYPVIRGNKGNVICVPNLATMYFSKFDTTKSLSLIMKKEV